jgi:hypothetical protein
MKKFNKVAALVVLGLMVFTVVSAQGLAAPANPGGLSDLSHRFGGSGGIAGIIVAVTNIILGIAGAVAILFIIVGGFQYILSGANEELAKRGKSTLRNAVIGLVIIVLSYTVVSIVYNTLTNVRV